MRSRAFVVALIVALLTLVPVGPASAEDVHASVQSLLAARARAVVDKDAESFMQTVDPDAPQDFVLSQQRRFDGLQSIPFVGYSLTADESARGDLAPGLGLDATYGVHTYLPLTTESFEFGEYTPTPLQNSFWYTYVQRNGRWYVGGLDDASVVGLASTPNIWDSGVLSVKPTEHFLIISSTDQVDRAAALGAIAEQGMTRFQSEWKLPWTAKIPLIIPSSPDQAATLLRTSSDVSRFAAFTSYVPLRDVGWQASSPVLYAQDANLAGSTVDSQVGTIVHELTHAATASLTGPNTPVWLQEGLAEWIRLGKPKDFALQKGATKTLPDRAAFGGSDAASIANAYNEATAAVSFLASTKGDDAPLALFEASGKSRVPTGTPSYNFDQAMQTSTGLSVDQFISGWQVVG